MIPLRCAIVLRNSPSGHASLNFDRELDQKGRELLGGGINIDSDGFMKIRSSPGDSLDKAGATCPSGERGVQIHPRHLLISHPDSIVLVTRHAGVTTKLNNPRPYDWERWSFRR